jgi:hypothetical protein
MCVPRIKLSKTQKGVRNVGENGKRVPYFDSPDHVVEISFNTPPGFIYLYKRAGLRISVSIGNIESFDDEEKVLTATRIRVDPRASLRA